MVGLGEAVKIVLAKERVNLCGEEVVLQSEVYLGHGLAQLASEGLERVAWVHYVLCLHVS